MAQLVLAQANVSVLRPGAEGDRALAAALDRIDLLAAMTPACRWTERTTSHGLLPELLADAVVVANLSTWTSYEQLHQFVYRSPHMSLVRRRQAWFERLTRPSTALWWVPPEDPPTLDEALRRLELLRLKGPTPEAFSPRKRFDPHGRRVGRQAQAGSTQA